VKVFVRRDASKNWLLWWGTSPKNIKYPLPEKRLQARCDPSPESLDVKLAAYRVKKNNIFQGNTEEFEATYNRKEKILLVKA
jgi:hypothetical protein